ncbi:MAG: hypothetical protein H6713_19200 [Myxococcales bacterium]|nr:hypothetical protein [Myxococcales bacterium]MCB9752097.1 hypothetical protein [Myxococcales bacterium]
MYKAPGITGSLLVFALAACSGDSTTATDATTDGGSTGGETTAGTTAGTVETTAGPATGGSTGETGGATEMTVGTSSGSVTTGATEGATTAGATTEGATTEGATTAGATETGGETEGDGWALPACDEIGGAPGFGFGPDEGATITPSPEPLPPGKTYTHGLAALEAPGVLVMEHAATVYRSTDAGCGWETLGVIDWTPTFITAGVDEHAWIWSDNASTLVHVDGATLEPLISPVANIKGLGADPDDAMRIRIGDGSGGLQESPNGGALWMKIGTPAPVGVLNYRAAFDPADLDHALFGGAQVGFYVTFDGGGQWQQSTFVGAEDHVINGFDAVVSAADGDVVWALGLDITDADADPDFTGRRLYRSEDGGLSFTPVVQQGAPNNDVILTNGTRIVAHPDDADILYFVFGTCFSGYGTNLYRYDAGDDSLTWHNHPYADFGQLAVSPADPTFLYVGIDGDDNPQCP